MQQRKEGLFKEGEREEIERLFNEFGLKLIPHSGKDGIIDLRAKKGLQTEHVTRKHIWITLRDSEKRFLLQQISKRFR